MGLAFISPALIRPLKLPAAVLLCLILPGVSCAEAGKDKVASGTMYGIGERQGTLLYRWSLQYVKGNKEHWLSQYVDSSGAVAAEDELFMKDGNFKEYRYVRHTTGERADVRAEGDKIIYDQEWGRKAKHSVEKLSANFVTGPYLFVYIQKNWNSLVRGEPLTIRFGVPDLLRSYEFRLSRDKQEEKARNKDKETVIIKVAAAGFFVRFFVDPILLEFAESERVPRRIIGRTLPVEKHGQRVVFIDGDLRIERNDKSLQLR